MSHLLKKANGHLLKKNTGGLSRAYPGLPATAHISVTGLQAISCRDWGSRMRVKTAIEASGFSATLNQTSPTSSTYEVVGEPPLILSTVTYYYCTDYGFPPDGMPADDNCDCTGTPRVFVYQLWGTGSGCQLLISRAAKTGLISRVRLLVSQTLEPVSWPYGYAPDIIGSEVFHADVYPSDDCFFLTPCGGGIVLENELTWETANIPPMFCPGGTATVTFGE